MLISEGYFYHIKDNFFTDVQDKNLMTNKENGNYRPHYFAVRDDQNNKIFWMVPVSSKYEKFQSILNTQIERYGKCTKIVLGKCDGRDAAFLIQNAFPVVEEYLDHIHLSNGNPLKLHVSTGKTIESCLSNNLKLKKRGINLFFADIDRIYRLMEDKLK